MHAGLQGHSDMMVSQFDQLQRKLVPLWESIGRSDPGGALEDENTVVVVPSLSVDVELSGSALQAYEERFMFMLFLLRQPLIRLIYVTSQAVHPSIVDYYLHTLPGSIVSNARKRLFMVAPFDDSPRTLTEKLLERPRFLRHIRSLIPDMDRAHLVPYNTTERERELAVQLGIPMYAADPRFFGFGTKSGCRQIFSEEGVRHPLGFENLRSEEAILAAIAQMRSQKPEIQRVIVKLNEGVAGMGNAVVDLSVLPPPGDSREAKELTERLHRMRFEMADLTYETYVEKVVDGGAIVEELIIGEAFESPSAQLRVSPLGELELLSTHDQLLGGPSGQTYLGATFPANQDYGPQIMREAAKVGRRFAREGIVGRFAVDFVVVKSSSGEWEPYAIEVNLRKGGTTHPFLTLQYLTDGRYDAELGEFATAQGHPKYYLASDHVSDPSYRVFTPELLFDVLSHHRLQFDHTSQTGVVLHMMSAVGSLGNLGVTAIADSPDDARRLYDRFVAVLDAESQRALTP
ncbi:MAG: peptide ligase PGM1-related protein [Chloroflexota bacterium]